VDNGMTAADRRNPHLTVVGEPTVDGPLHIADLYAAHGAFVAGIAHRITGSGADVDDIVQDTFLDAERGLSGLRNGAAVRGWLAAIAVRRARRHMRKCRLLGFFGFERPADYDAVADRSASPEQRAEVSAIYRLLDGFSVDERIAWTLRYVQGEQVSRIAQLCGCSRATIHRRIAVVQTAIQEASHD